MASGPNDTYPAPRLPRPLSAQDLAREGPAYIEAAHRGWLGLTKLFSLWEGFGDRCGFEPHFHFTVPFGSAVALEGKAQA